MKRLLLACLLWASAADARSLHQIEQSGSLMLCAHPNSLPFASKTGEKSGFQVELARAMAKQLGVELGQEWIVLPSQVFRSNCDIILDVIGEQKAQSESGLQVSKPYYRGGLVLVVPRDSAIHGFADLNAETKIGVQYASTTAMTLNQRHVAISIFAFEDEMLEAVARREVAGAVVSRTVAAYWNATHPEQQVTLFEADKSEANMHWNIAIGMRRPDPALRQAVDAAIDRLTADGTIAAIYAHYGITVTPPE